MLSSVKEMASCIQLIGDLTSTWIFGGHRDQAVRGNFKRALLGGTILLLTVHIKRSDFITIGQCLIGIKTV